ncbi:MAG: hypothetical protein Q8S55_16435, partial [Methylococcaceae bacterium]|nr:hypothetical protein [Methylococcaceae bacterium]
MLITAGDGFGQHSDEEIQEQGRASQVADAACLQGECSAKHSESGPNSASRPDAASDAEVSQPQHPEQQSNSGGQCQRVQTKDTYLAHLLPATNLIKLSMPKLWLDGSWIPVEYRDLTQFEPPRGTRAPSKIRVSLEMEDAFKLPWLSESIHLLRGGIAADHVKQGFLKCLSLILQWKPGGFWKSKSVTDFISSSADIDGIMGLLDGLALSTKRCVLMTFSSILSGCKATNAGDASIFHCLCAHVSLLSREFRKGIQLQKDQQTDRVHADKNQWMSVEQFTALAKFACNIFDSVGRSPALISSTSHACFVRDVMILRLAITVGMQRSEVWSQAELLSAIGKSSKPHVALVEQLNGTYTFVIHKEKNQRSLGSYRQLIVEGECAHHLAIYLKHVRSTIVRGYTTNLVFPVESGLQLTPAAFHSRMALIVHALLGISLTPRILRRLMETHFMSMCKTKQEASNVALKFGNESQTAALSYRVSHHMCTSDGWHPVLKELTTRPQKQLCTITAAC